MPQNDFFQEIEHIPVPWEGKQLYVPVFYQDTLSMTVLILAPTAKIKTLLPSKRLHPYRITPRQSIINITTYQYRECDIGPYNEVAIAVPVTIDQPTPLFAGSLRKTPEVPKQYFHHLPVTTEIACKMGVEFAGYPKFLADIEFSDEGDWLSCEFKVEDQHVLTLRGRKLALQHAPRGRANPLNYRQGYILLSASVTSEREIGTSRDPNDVELILGEHDIADELRNLDLGKVMAYQYCPHFQLILTNVFETLKA